MEVVPVYAQSHPMRDTRTVLDVSVSEMCADDASHRRHKLLTQKVGFNLSSKRRAAW